MIEETINENQITGFGINLLRNERAAPTIQKYVRTVYELAVFVKKRPLTKELLLEYRKHLREKYKAQTVNGKVSAINSFMDYSGLPHLKMNLLRVQRRAFVDDDRELSEAEYKRLLLAAKREQNERLYNVMLTICSTGIRISELKYITAENVRRGRAEISMKGKERVILIPKELRLKLKVYADKNNIRRGCIFITKSGKTLDRSNICHDMKKLCNAARVDAHKVFPHNLRHLFARSYYKVEKNLAHLADILGHSSIETTRIYVAVSAKQCEHMMSRMQLII